MISPYSCSLQVTGACAGIPNWISKFGCTITNFLPHCLHVRFGSGIFFMSISPYWLVGCRKAVIACRFLVGFFISVSVNFVVVGKEFIREIEQLHCVAFRCCYHIGTWRCGVYFLHSPVVLILLPHDFHEGRNNVFYSWFLEQFHESLFLCCRYFLHNRFPFRNFF